MSRQATSPPNFDLLDERHGDVLDRLAELEAQVEAVLNEYVATATEP